MTVQITDSHRMVTVVLLLYVFLPNIYSETIVCDEGQTTTDCNVQTLSCTSDELCTIRCELHLRNATNHSICHNSIINCKEGYNCLVECDGGIEACKGITINAQNATALDVISMADTSYNSAHIYCPINGLCRFTAIPLNTQEAFSGMIIFSRNGFTENTLDIKCSAANCLDNAIMSCTDDYSQSCLIDMCKEDHICGALSTETLEDPVIESSSLCKGWEITINYTLSMYNNRDNDELQTLFTNAFIETILYSYNNKWNDNWCYDVKDIQIDNMTFIINNRLYSDYFLNHGTDIFIHKFKQYLTQNITDLSIQQLIYTFEDTSLQREGPHDEKRSIINVSVIVIVLSCCVASIYTVCRCWAFEKTVDETNKDNKSTSNNKEITTDITNDPISNISNKDVEIQIRSMETIMSQSLSTTLLVKEEVIPPTEEIHEKMSTNQTDYELNEIFEVVMSAEDLSDNESDSVP